MIIGTSAAREESAPKEANDRIHSKIDQAPDRRPRPNRAISIACPGMCPCNWTANQIRTNRWRGFQPIVRGEQPKLSSVSNRYKLQQAEAVLDFARHYAAGPGGHSGVVTFTSCPQLRLSRVHTEDRTRKRPVPPAMDRSRDASPCRRPSSLVRCARSDARWSGRDGWDFRTMQKPATRRPSLPATDNVQRRCR